MNRAKAKRTRHRPGHTELFGSEPAKRRVNLRLVMMLAMILLVAGGIIGLSMSVPDKQAKPAQTPAISTTIPALANTSGIQNPTHHQYDPLTNKHWVAGGGHDHWHNGRPPGSAGSTPPGFNPTTILSSGSTSSANPNIPNPTPGQYDPVTDRYWHVPPGGSPHWHNGRPPAEGGTAPPPGFDPTTFLNSGSTSAANPDIPNPTPGQYDPVTDRYWHVPAGGSPHWHKGRPPAEGNP